MFLEDQKPKTKAQAFILLSPQQARNSQKKQHFDFSRRFSTSSCLADDLSTIEEGKNNEKSQSIERNNNNSYRQTSFSLNQPFRSQLNLDDAISRATSGKASSGSENIRITEEICDDEANELDNVRWVFSPPFHLYSPRGQDAIAASNELNTASHRKKFQFVAGGEEDNNRKLEIEIEKLSNQDSSETNGDSDISSHSLDDSSEDGGQNNQLCVKKERKTQLLSFGASSNYSSTTIKKMQTQFYRDSRGFTAAVEEYKSIHQRDEVTPKIQLLSQKTQFIDSKDPPQYANLLRSQ